MSTFSQWSLDDILYKMTFEQLIYWHKLALYKNYNIDPMKSENGNKKVLGSAEVTNEMFEKLHTYDSKKGWIRKH